MDHIDKFARQLRWRLWHSWSGCGATRIIGRLILWCPEAGVGLVLTPVVDNLGRAVEAGQVGSRGDRWEEGGGGDGDRPGSSCSTWC